MELTGRFGVITGLVGCEFTGIGKILKPSGQVIKGVWRMSRCQEAMKGVEDCDKPGEAVKQALIPGSPNVIRGIHRRMRQTR